MKFYKFLRNLSTITLMGGVIATLVLWLLSLIDPSFLEYAQYASVVAILSGLMLMITIPSVR